MAGLLTRRQFFEDLHTATDIDAALKEHELKLGGEQRDVTVAFIDVRGFATLADCIQPGELVTVLNTYLSVVIKALLKHGAMINKFGGDSIMAVWNSPTDCEEHALLATMAAIEAQQAIRELRGKEPTLPKIDFSIGINTGKVIAVSIGYEYRLEYSVIGDSVNIVAKLTSAVPGGKIWITIDTFELVKDYISAKPIEPLTVKGNRQLIKAYEVLGIHAELADL